MTAQIPDSISIENKEYSIVGVNGSGLFEPQSLGITPVAVMSSCWRGYVCHYKVADNRLILDGLQVSLRMDEDSGAERRSIPQAGPEINGKKPVITKTGFHNVYEGLNLEIPFSGGILAGDGFIRELYVHMGFHPAWKYQTVLELFVEDGEVHEIHDVSKRMELWRHKMSRSPDKPDILNSTRQEVESWIEKTFRLDYDPEE